MIINYISKYSTYRFSNLLWFIKFTGKAVKTSVIYEFFLNLQIRIVIYCAKDFIINYGTSGLILRTCLFEKYEFTLINIMYRKN